MPVIKDVVCTLCGCLCDDLEVTVEDNKITTVGKACTPGRAKPMGPVLHARRAQPRSRETGEMRAYSYDEASTKPGE